MGFLTGLVVTALGVQAASSLYGAHSAAKAAEAQTNAAREAWGYQVEAVDLRRRAVLARREGVLLEQAGRAEAHGYRVGGALSAAGTIAGGTASLLQARYGFNQGTRRPGGVLERVTTPRGGPYAPRGAYA